MANNAVIVPVLLAAVVLLAAGVMTLTHSSFKCSIDKAIDPELKKMCDLLTETAKLVNKEPAELVCDGNAFVASFKMKDILEMSLTCPWKGMTVVFEALAVVLSIVFALGAVLHRTGKNMIPPKATFFIGIGSVILLLVAVVTMFLTPKGSSKYCDDASAQGAECSVSALSYHLTAFLTLIAAVIIGYDVFAVAKKDIDGPSGNTSYLAK